MRGWDQFMLRFPDGMRDIVKESAGQNRRSMNGEIVFILQQYFAETTATGEGLGNSAPVAAQSAALQGGQPTQG